MKTLMLRVCAIALALLAAPAFAQVVRVPVVTNSAGSPMPAGASVIVGSNGAEKGTSGNPVVTSGNVVLGALAASGKTAVTGTFTATGTSAAFTPVAGRQMNVTISSGVAVCQVERSFDSGTTWFVEISDSIRTSIPESFTLTEAEVGTQVRINCTGYTSGTVTYRLSM